MRRLLTTLFGAASMLWAPAAAYAAEPAPAAQAPKPLPYTIPWQLRPVLVPNVIRWDNGLVSYQVAGRGAAFSWVGILNAIVRIPGTGGPAAGLGAVLRLPFAFDSTPSGAVIANPQIGATYGMKLGSSFRLNFFVGCTIPIGMGGGDTPDAAQKNARQRGQNARAQFDNAIFAVNDVAINPGASIAYVDHDLTLQVEVTLFQLWRVRGCTPMGPCDQREATKTNFTTGIHAGYFVHPRLSVGLDLRYQRWINAPFSVEGDATMDAYDNLTFAVGPRFHIPIGTHWLRPGIAYSRGIDRPMGNPTKWEVGGAPYQVEIVQVDVPFLF